ncbi:MAG: hypothetical protein CBC93_03050 [Gammaproteobacteria bacterium TMED133]|nr:MAG: hypothetical protein CBC93_03050 [Gammaproteobacteria bacterium TMED133]
MLLVVCMMMVFVDTIFFIMENTNPISSPNQTKMIKANVIPSETINFSELNLFGAKGKEGLSKRIDAPSTRLALDLLGVFKSGKVRDSSAVVAQKGNDGKLYRIGERLPGDAILDSVYENFILIKRGSRLEKLMFSEGNFSTSIKNVRDRQDIAPIQSEVINNKQITENMILNESNEIKENSAQLANSPKEVLLELINPRDDKVTINPSEAFARIGINLVEENNTKGYKLDSADKTLVQAGLKNGDVIMSVNGIALGEAAMDAAALAQALAQKRARIEIKRGTKRLFLTVPIP